MVNQVSLNYEERFKEKSKKLSDTMTSFHSDATMNVSWKEIYPGLKSQRYYLKAQRLINIAKRRGASLNDILKHDFIIKNVLLDGDFTVKPAKHVTTVELEEHLNKGEDFTFKKGSELSVGVFVPFMSVVRCVPLKKIHIFREVLEFWGILVPKSAKLTSPLTVTLRTP